MVRILRPNGRALIYVWAKNQSFQKASNYLRQNRRNAKESEHENCDVKTNENIENKNSSTPLPIHTNRTQFEHTDILVPWKLKNPTKSSSQNGSSDQHPTTFLRFYHVFEENELETLCKQFENLTIEKSYYDQGNWCVIFRKTDNFVNNDFENESK